jgi:hypothetical protein
MPLMTKSSATLQIADSTAAVIVGVLMRAPIGLGFILGEETHLRGITAE